MYSLKEFSIQFIFKGQNNKYSSFQRIFLHQFLGGVPNIFCEECILSKKYIVNSQNMKVCLIYLINYIPPHV